MRQTVITSSSIGMKVNIRETNGDALLPRTWEMLLLKSLHGLMMALLLKSSETYNMAIGRPILSI